MPRSQILTLRVYGLAMKTNAALGLILFGTSAASQEFSPAAIEAVIKSAGSVESLVGAMSDNIARMSGRLIDNESRLIGGSSLGRVVVYHVKLSNYAEEDIGDKAGLRASVAKSNAPKVCTAPTIGYLIQRHSVKARYMVYSSDDKYLFQYEFSKVTCKVGYIW